MHLAHRDVGFVNEGKWTYSEQNLVFFFFEMWVSMDFICFFQYCTLFVLHIGSEFLKLSEYRRGQELNFRGLYPAPGLVDTVG
jgi:hypothetical protein